MSYRPLGKIKTRLICSDGFMILFFNVHTIISSPESKYENDGDVTFCCSFVFNTCKNRMQMYLKTNKYYKKV